MLPAWCVCGPSRPVREGKQLSGLGDYKGRSWQGWHRHMTLCMVMYFFVLRGKLASKSNPT
ncbi:MAG: hypothetical protein F4Y37_00360 [Caldilineaceae bacterium SB0664_bin_22]|nr:hypothetical protein [Caldilineaceae bacterium SB0664_bin_22]